MPVPSKNTVARKRPDIQDSVMDFDLQANNEKMIANRVFPFFEVGEAGGNYGRIKAEQLLQISKTTRASGGSYNRIEYEFEEAFYQTTENGLEGPVDERDKKLYADYFDAELVTAEVVRSDILINREIRVRDKTFGNSDIPTQAGTAPWSDWANSDPIKDIFDARIAIYRGDGGSREGIGLWANALVLSYELFLNLQNSAKLLDRISANGAGDKIKPTDVTEQMVAQALNIQELVVGGAGMNTAKKGLGLDVAQIWDPTKAMVAHLVPEGSRNIRQPGLGRSFHWGEDGSQINGLQESYWDETCRSEIERCRHETDERCTYAKAGQIITGLIA